MLCDHHSGLTPAAGKGRSLFKHSLHCVDHIRPAAQQLGKSHAKTRVIQSINQSSPDFTAQESSAGTLLSCRCTSQITPEGNYQAINPDVMRMAAAYFAVKKKSMQLVSIHYLHESMSRRARGSNVYRRLQI